MNPAIKAGVAIQATDIGTSRNCGIDPDLSRGYIYKAGEQGVSIYLDKKYGGGG